MQILIRFAYGKVITIDIIKALTTVAELIKIIMLKLKLPKNFQFALLFNNTSLTPSEKLVCSYGIVKNSVLDFQETKKDKKVDIQINYMIKGADFYTKAQWKSIVIKQISISSTVAALKAEIKKNTEIDPKLQKLLFGTREITNDTDKLVDYGIDRYELLDYIYKDKEDKKEELKNINTFIIYCLKREIAA